MIAKHRPKHRRGRVIVVGSVNVDSILTLPRLPRPGETMRASSSQLQNGGKGANAAVAAVRGGAEVHLLGAVGSDTEGDAALSELEAEGVNVSLVSRSERRTGHAVVITEEQGENIIVVDGGANDDLHADDVAALLRETLRPEDVLVTNVEVPPQVALAAIRTGLDVGAAVIVDPTPTDRVPEELLAPGVIATPNYEEACALLAETDSGEVATARDLATKTGATIALTRGSKGCVVVDGDDQLELPAPQVEVVDSVGAGDTFTGWLAAELARGSNLSKAASLAVVAASFTVQGQGARRTMPDQPTVHAAIAADDTLGCR